MTGGLTEHLSFFLKNFLNGINGNRRIFISGIKDHLVTSFTFHTPITYKELAEEIVARGIYEEESSSLTPLAQHNIYICEGIQDAVNRPPKSRRLSQKQVDYIRTVSVDIDVAGQHGDSKRNLVGSKSEAIEFLSLLPIKPSMIVDTGGGIQAWWFLSGEVPAGKKVKVLRRGWIRWLRHEFGYWIDSTHNLDRLMRLPGTINQKYADRPAFIVKCTIDGELLRPDLMLMPLVDECKLEDLQKIVPNEFCGGDIDESGTILKIEDVALDDAETPLKSLPESVKCLIDEDEEIRELWEHQRIGQADTSQSGWDMSLAMMLCDAGVSPEDVKKALIINRLLYSPEKAKKAQRDDYYNRTISRAIERIKALETPDIPDDTKRRQQIMERLTSQEESPSQEEAPPSEPLLTLDDNLSMLSLEIPQDIEVEIEETPLFKNKLEAKAWLHEAGYYVEKVYQYGKEGTEYEVLWVNGFRWTFKDYKPLTKQETWMKMRADWKPKKGDKLYAKKYDVIRDDASYKGIKWKEGIIEALDLLTTLIPKRMDRTREIIEYLSRYLLFSGCSILFDVFEVEGDKLQFDRETMEEHLNQKPTITHTIFRKQELLVLTVSVIGFADYVHAYLKDKVTLKEVYSVATKLAPRRFNMVPTAFTMWPKLRDTIIGVPVIIIPRSVLEFLSPEYVEQHYDPAAARYKARLAAVKVRGTIDSTENLSTSIEDAQRKIVPIA